MYVVPINHSIYIKHIATSPNTKTTQAWESLPTRNTFCSPPRPCQASAPPSQEELPEAYADGTKQKPAPHGGKWHKRWDSDQGAVIPTKPMGAGSSKTKHGVWQWKPSVSVAALRTIPAPCLLCLLGEMGNGSPFPWKPHAVLFPAFKHWGKVCKQISGDQRPKGFLF